VVEIDSSGVSINRNKTTARIEFAALRRIHFWEIKSLGVATAVLELLQDNGGTAALGGSTFEGRKAFETFLNAAAEFMRALGETRPSVPVLLEPPAMTRWIGLLVIPGTAMVLIVAANLYFRDRHSIADYVAAIGALLFSFGFLVFRFGLLRRRKAPVAADEFARQLSERL
jgi:hypothetical protein